MDVKYTYAPEFCLDFTRCSIRSGNILWGLAMANNSNGFNTPIIPAGTCSLWQRHKVTVRQRNGLVLVVFGRACTFFDQHGNEQARSRGPALADLDLGGRVWEN